MVPERSRDVGVWRKWTSGKPDYCRRRSRLDGNWEIVLITGGKAEKGWQKQWAECSLADWRARDRRLLFGGLIETFWWRMHLLLRLGKSVSGDGLKEEEKGCFVETFCNDGR